MGDREMRFKTRFYRERHAAEGIFTDAQEEHIMERTRCGTFLAAGGVASATPHYGELTINLLACRAKLALHSLPTQVPVVVGGGIDGRGRDPSLLQLFTER